MYKILLVDDDTDLITILKLYFETEDIEVLVAHDGEQGLSCAQNEDIHLVVIDIMMPKLDGLALLKQLRESKDIPVIIMSAKGADDEKIIGLRLGADDYLTKPFSPMELVARVQAQLRRAYNFNMSYPVESKTLTVGMLELNLDKVTLSFNSKEIPLTQKDFHILKLMLSSPDRVFTKQQIYEAAWEDEYLPTDSALTVHMSRLRSLFESEFNIKDAFTTVRGLGYKLNKEVFYEKEQ